MEIKKTLLSVIEASDLNNQQKLRLTGFVNNACDHHAERVSDVNLIIQKAGELRKITDVVVSTPYVKIYKISGTDEWDLKYPYRSIYLDKNNEWQRNDNVSDTLDQAYLSYLEKKNLGSNSQFLYFATKMLQSNTNN